MASVFEHLAILMLFVVIVNGYTPSLYYLDEECNHIVQLTKDARLKLSYYSNYLDLNWKCSVTFRTSISGDNLLVQYRSMDTRWSTNCRTISLKILDSDKATSLNGPYGNCGGIPAVSVFTSSGNSITFKMQTNNLFQHGHFDILITSFNNAGVNGTCGSGRFHCDNDRCINNNLVCNGYNDCGDDSDEGCHLGGGIVAGIVIGVFVFIALCITLSVIGRRRRRYARLCEAKPYDTCHATTTTTTYVQRPNIQSSYPPPSYQTYGR